MRTVLIRTQWRDIADRCHDRGKQCWLALPQIFRSHAQRYLGANRRLLCQAGFDGVLIRALEEAVWLKDLMEQENQKTSLPFGMDASVYGWNSRPQRCWPLWDIPAHHALGAEQP